MNLTLGFSPCPNDTFMFEAIINHRIDLEGIKFNVSIDDVSQLNKWSFDGRLDVTKLSFNAFKYCVKNYALLDSGSAIGRNCGPLLIKKPKTKLTSQSSIAIPGKYTTANMLLESAFPQFLNKHEVLFSEIEEPYFYFLHSYYFSPKIEEITIGKSFSGKEFTSIFKYKNFYGTQFHPEKSHQNGIKLLRNFALI